MASKAALTVEEIIVIANVTEMGLGPAFSPGFTMRVEGGHRLVLKHFREVRRKLAFARGHRRLADEKRALDFKGVRTNWPKRKANEDAVAYFARSVEKAIVRGLRRSNPKAAPHTAQETRALQASAIPVPGKTKSQTDRWFEETREGVVGHGAPSTAAKKAV